MQHEILSALSETDLAVLATLKDPDAPNNDPKFDFGDDPANQQLQSHILSAILAKKSILAALRPKIESGYFTDKANQLICKIALDFYDKYQEPASFDALKTELSFATKDRSDKVYYVAQLQTLLDIHQVYPEKYLIEKVSDFARTQQFRRAILEAFDTCQANKPDKWAKINKLKPVIDAALTGETIVDDVSAVESFDQFMSSVDDEPQFVIQDFLEEGMLMLLAGDAKGGKTTLAVNMSVDTLIDGRAIGGDAKRLPILYLDYENRRHNLKRTITKAIQGRDTTDLKRYFHPASRHVPKKATNHKALPDYVTVEYLKTIAAKHSAPGIIIIDTFAGAFRNYPKKPDKWENDSDFIGKVLRPIQDWCHDSDWCVIVLHHTNAQGGIRGSTEFKAAVDAIVFFKRQEEERTVTLKIDGRFGDAIDTKQMVFENGRYAYQGTVKDVGKATKKNEQRNIRDMVFERIKQGECSHEDIYTDLNAILEKQNDKIGRDAIYKHLTFLKDKGIIRLDARRYSVADGGEMIYAMLQHSNND